MPTLLQGAGTDGELSSAYGSPGVGTGADVLMELERIRANLLALAEVVEDLRAKHNAHTHNTTVVAPPPPEQSNVPYIPH